MDRWRRERLREEVLSEKDGPVVQGKSTAVVRCRAGGRGGRAGHKGIFWDGAQSLTDDSGTVGEMS